jgi:hypothetical protein
MKLLSLFLLIFCIAIFRKHVLPKNYYYLDGPKDRATLSHWIKKIKSDLTSLVFVNWNAGGTSSISGLLKGKFNRIYSKTITTGQLIVRYGLNKQDGIELRKTEDVLQFNSALGYRKTHSLTGTTPQNSISTQFRWICLPKYRSFHI